ncbi:D-glycero-beta-D-manno-heptose-7-phosphate kinase [Nitrospira defluvii]|nr:D-glycero-beta-D-manno-heptose-7-phosphate kinase [Nitrospira defluvii]
MGKLFVKDDRVIAMGLFPSVLEKFSDRKVLILGDLMLDHYIWGRVKRISPEAPVPVVEVSSESVRMGGAGNVLNNILGLGGKAILCGVIGTDDAGHWLSERIQSKSGDTSGLVIEESRSTTKKTRIIAHQQQVVRFDHEARRPILQKTENRIIDYVLSRLSEVDCLAISDYSKGAVTERILQPILLAAIERDIPIVVDPKVNHFSFYQKVTLITPNHLEAMQASGIEIEDETSLKKAGERFLKQLDCKAVLITRGEQGMSLFEKGGKVTHIPTEAKQVFDVTGAGDTVLSTLSISLAAGLSLLDAASLSNIAAGIVVGIVGTAAIEKEMLQKVLLDK